MVKAGSPPIAPAVPASTACGRPATSRTTAPSSSTPQPPDPPLPSRSTTPTSSPPTSRRLSTTTPGERQPADRRSLDPVHRRAAATPTTEGTIMHTTPVAVVTGASSGIGRATALALVDAGFVVVGTSRKAANAEPLAG